MALHGLLHLFTVAVFRGNKIWADEQQDDVGCVEMLINLLFPCRTCMDVGVAPDRDQTLPLQWHEVLFKIPQQFLIFAGIAAKDFDCGYHRHLPSFLNNPSSELRTNSTNNEARDVLA